MILEPAESTVITVNQSMVAEFDCSAAGIPTPDISWFRVFDNGSIVELTTAGCVIVTRLQPDNEFLLEDRGIVSQVNSTLILMNTVDSDSGTYRCVARNNASGDGIMQDIQLVVQGTYICEGHFYEHTVNVHA